MPQLCRRLCRRHSFFSFFLFFFFSFFHIYIFFIVFFLFLPRHRSFYDSSLIHFPVTPSTCYFFLFFHSYILCFLKYYYLTNLHIVRVDNRVVLWHVRRGGTRLRCVASLTDGAAAGTWRGETDASGLHGVDLAAGLARMLLPGVPLGRPDTTGWRGPLVKDRSWEVKGLDLVVKR